MKRLPKCWLFLTWRSSRVFWFTSGAINFYCSITPCINRLYLNTFMVVIFSCFFGGTEQLPNIVTRSEHYKVSPHDEHRSSGLWSAKLFQTSKFFSFYLELCFAWRCRKHFFCFEICKNIKWSKIIIMFIQSTDTQNIIELYNYVLPWKSWPSSWWFYFWRYYFETALQLLILT